MRLTRRQLRRIISESIYNGRMNEEVGKYLGFDEVDAHPKALKFKSAPGGPLADLQKKIKEKVGAKISLDKYYLAKDFYETYKSKGVPGLLGMTGPSLGISGKGDPYTYKPMGGGKYKVISGPNPKAIGKVFKAKKKGGEENVSVSKTIDFIKVEDLNDFFAKIRERSSEFGLADDVGATTDTRATKTQTIRDAVKEATAGNIGIVDVKDALIDVAESQGNEVLMAAFSQKEITDSSKDGDKKYIVYIGYSTPGVEGHSITVEMTDQFVSESAGMDSYVAPSSSNQSSSGSLSESFRRRRRSRRW